jgi:hypothetical protein
MQLRVMLLAAPLLASTAPLRAEEVQLDFGGTACLNTVDCTVQNSVPFAISFDLNTLSGTRTTSFIPVNGVGCLETFLAQGISMTNFKALVGGSFQTQKSGSAAVITTLFGGSGPCETHGYQFGLDLLPAPGFVYETSISPSLTQSQYEASKDPLLVFLSDVPPGRGIGVLQNWDLSVTSVSVHVAAVPEPPAWAMLVPGLFGVGLMMRARRL